MRGKKMKMVLIAATILGTAATVIPFNALASGNPVNPYGSAPGMNASSITAAIEQAVGKVIVYPMEQFAQVIKYTFDSRPAKASATTQSRFPELPATQAVSQVNNVALQTAMSKIITGANGQNNVMQATLAASPNELCHKTGLLGKQTCISTQTAQTCLS